QSLPTSLNQWRQELLAEPIWQALLPFFLTQGFTFWRPVVDQLMRCPEDLDLVQNAYHYVKSSRLETRVGSVRGLRDFLSMNPLSYTAQNKEGSSVVIRVISIKQDGLEHLDILRKLATGHSSLLVENHTLPMLQELQHQDIIFGIFPLVGADMRMSIGFWAENSVGDIMDMLMQALEALVYIHKQGIAHRDAFHDNFLIQYQPESLLSNRVSCSRPRIYLIDFEVAVEFPPTCVPEDRFCQGIPSGGSFGAVKEDYSRSCPNDVWNEERYDPFKLDVWQLAAGLDEYKFMTGIQEIDQVITAMNCDDSDQRLSAADALERLGNVVNVIPPISLLIAPLCTRLNYS
ncbi:hypothetical protein K435DRAFT_903331, partial [Dendrothele bispora CBS 962.96]